MGFFSDLKEDLSQAVNELIPEENTDIATDAEKAQVEEVKDEQADNALSLDEMLENIDSIQLPEEEEIAEGTEDEMATGLETTTEETGVFAGADTFTKAEETVGTDENVGMDETVEADKDDVADMWDLDSMLENALTEEKIHPIAKTEEYKGVGKTMEMNTERVAVDETSIITRGMTLNGDIVSEGSLDIIGAVNGNIDIMGKLNITGHIDGNSKATEIFAEGAKITGEVVSEGSVKIGASTVIVGNITATSAAIAGAVKGDIDVRGPVVLDASAIVMGNIKSKSVQINNGAVIEGMCSQCYADVSPSSFFDEYKVDSKKEKSK